MYVFYYTVLFCLAFGLDSKLLHAQEAETSAEPKETTGASVTHPPHAAQTRLSPRSLGVPVPETSTPPDDPTPRSELDSEGPTIGNPASNGTQDPTSGGGIPDPGIPTTVDPESTDAPDTAVHLKQETDTTRYTTVTDPDDQGDISTTEGSSLAPEMQPGHETTPAAVQESPSTPGSMTPARPGPTGPQDAVSTTMRRGDTTAPSTPTAPTTLTKPIETTITPSPSPATSVTTSEAVPTSPYRSSPGATGTTRRAPDPTSVSTQRTANVSATAGAAVVNPGLDLRVVIICAIVACVLLFCVICVVLNCKRKSRRQDFGHQADRTKKKAAEADVWAGPVKLAGGDKAASCGELDEGLGQEDDKDTDGTKVMLSTFVAPEANGGVGRPGSKEVQKWEEKEPLLYIDSEAKTDRKKEEDGGNASGAEKTDEKTPVLNGGEAFCLTTAV